MSVIGRITELILTPQGPAQEQLGIAFVGESKTAVKLHRAVAGKSKSVTALRLGHTQGPLNFFGIVLSNTGGGAIQVRPASLHGQQNLHRGVFQ